MTPPRLVSVDVGSEPPTMTVVFPGDRWATIRIRSHVHTHAVAIAIAAAELASLTPAELELLEEIAKPGPLAPDIVHVRDAVGAMITPVTQDPRPNTPVHCPGCGFRLGYADSPTTCYLSRCSACERQLRIEVTDRAVVVALYVADAS